MRTFNFAGIISRISHLEYLSVKVVCLAPIFPWSAAQYGQSATTFTNVHPELGTLKDMATLAEELHKRGNAMLHDNQPGVWIVMGGSNWQ